MSVHKTRAKGAVMDVARGELVEKELDAMIERRSRQKDPEEESETWQESERRHEEQRRLQARYEWHLYHTAQAERVRRPWRSLLATTRTKPRS